MRRHLLRSLNLFYHRRDPCSSSSNSLKPMMGFQVTSFSTANSSSQSEKLSKIVEEVSGLTLLEVADLTDLLRLKLGVEEMPVMAVMMPGMGMGGPATSGRGAGLAGKAEEKKEKSVFDLKLESFDSAAKIKIIKELRTFTDLGLKEAKELVEKAPAVLKKGVLKEEAEKIAEKMKEIGAKVVLE